MPTQTSTAELGEAQLFEAFVEARAATQEVRQSLVDVSKEAWEAAVQYKGVVDAVAEQFVGRSVRISPLDGAENAITAYYYATPYPRFGRPGYRPQEPGITTRTHPRNATGAIASLWLWGGELNVTPRWFSPYRFDKGFFKVKMLDQNQEPLVKVEFLDK